MNSGLSAIAEEVLNRAFHDVYGSELLGLRTFSERDQRLALTFANPNHFAAFESMLAI